MSGENWCESGNCVATPTKEVFKVYCEAASHYLESKGGGGGGEVRGFRAIYFGRALFVSLSVPPI